MNSFNQLSIERIACEKGDTRLFEACSFKVQEGDLVQIEGHNGIGKTSLLRILTGLSLPVEGDVLWNGTKIQKCREEYNQILFYLGHYPGIKSELTPWENLRFYQKLQNLP